MAGVYPPKRRWVRYSQLTVDPRRRPSETARYVVSHLPGEAERAMGDRYGWRTWTKDGSR
jgi:hypothetical protein